MPRIEYVSGPAAEPVSLADMRSHIRQRTDSGQVDDALVTALIPACRAAVEQYLGLTLLHTTYRIWYDVEEIESKLNIPLSPLASLTSVKLYDEDDVAVTATGTTYYTSTYGRRPFVALKAGNTWPTTTGTQRAHNSLVVEGVFGYDADGLGVSEAEFLIAEQAIKAWIFYLYANRGNMDSAKLLNATAQVYRTLPPEIMAMLSPIADWRL